MNFEEFTKQLNMNITNMNNTTSDTTTQITMNPSKSSVNDTQTPVVKKKLKLLFVSTHINQVNGYSKVAYNLVKQLANIDWIQVIHFGTQRLKNADIQRKYPDGVKVIDGSALDKNKDKDGVGFGFTELSDVIRSEKPDIVFIYNDILVISGYIEEIRKAFTGRTFKLWAYIDTMYNAIPQKFIDNLNRDIDRVFCFTKTWKDELKQSGLTRPADVLNHGLDNKIFRTIPRDLARQSVGLPRDAFIFLSMNRNQPRKRLDLLVMSFVELIVKHPMKPIFMLVIGDKGDNGGYQLFDIFSRELKARSVSVDTYGNRLMISSSNSCYKDEDINVFYNMADACVSCAEGEGFGLCSFESMGVGIPQIVPNINGYSEYCNAENSLMVQPKYKYYLPQAYNMITGEAHIVDVKDVVEAMEQYVFDEELRKRHGAKGKETISKYTWEKACGTLIKRLRYEYEEEDD